MLNGNKTNHGMIPDIGNILSASAIKGEMIGVSEQMSFVEREVLSFMTSHMTRDMCDFHRSMRVTPWGLPLAR